MKRYLFPLGATVLIIVLYALLALDKGLADRFGTLANLMALTTALLTFWYVVYTAQMVRSIQESAEAENRPYIVFKIKVDADRFVTFCLENIGKQPAKDLKITFNPPLPKAYARAKDFPGHIRYFAPGQTYEPGIGFAPDLVQRPELSQIAIDVEYSWGAGHTTKQPEIIDLLYACHLPRNANPPEKQRLDALVKMTDEVKKVREAIEASRES